MARYSADSRPFLTAEWRNLVLVSYAVGDDLLLPHLPAGLELDRFGGWACCSLVAFDFLNTRVKGVRWPGYVNFPEVNLRFYVRDADGRRGVCFVRELVPRRAIVWIARRLYNEPYARAAMRSEVKRGEDEIRVAHRWRFSGREHSLEVRGAQPPHRPDEDSIEHWFKEHSWGYGRDRKGRTLVYRVEHPVWDVHTVRSFELKADFAAMYGGRWRLLDGARPINVTLAVGSGVAVFPTED